MSNHIWYKEYPQNINKEISIAEYTCIADAMNKTCSKYANAPVISCSLGLPGSTKEISFNELNTKASHFAAYLQGKLGLKKGDRIAIMLPNIWQFPIVTFAAHKIGLICVNTNPLYTPREMKHQFNDSGAETLVIVDVFMDKLEEIASETKIKNIIQVSLADELPFLIGGSINLLMKLKGAVPKHSLSVHTYRDTMVEGTKLQYKPVKMSLDDVAVLQYTGGTTGVAKGAMLTQGNILSNMMQIVEWAKVLNIGAGDVVLTALPLYHIFAFTVNFLTFMKMGGKLVLVPKPIPIDNTARLFAKFDFTVMTGVNTLFNALNHSEVFKGIAPKNLKLALAGGMALQDSVSREFQAITGRNITEGFGLTEASPVTHCNPLHITPPRGSIGLPLPSTDAKVVNEKGEEVDVGEEGELIIKGPQVMKGYWQREEETKNTIKNGWLWTGDMAKMDDKGYFYIIDRKKDLVIVSGFNVYPNEVEEVLVSHPKVLEAAVIGLPDPNSGEKVKAFIVKKDESLTEEELKAHATQNLTNYKRPKLYEFRKELPKSNVGKILRKDLRDT